jgi:SAM-dependent methyltransferase
LHPFSPEYQECRTCGALASCVGLTADEVRVGDDARDFYGQSYWLGHQTHELGLPDIARRARADLPERCMHWLRTLLPYKPPPAAVLEVGCAHGGFVALLRALGYDASGLEVSPWVVEFARRTFDVPMLLGPVEEQRLPARSFDAVVLNDVLEHLPDPVATVRRCADLVKDDGVLVIQTPCFPEGATYEDLCARRDRFLEMMDARAATEHLHLFSRRSVRRLLGQLGFAGVAFEPALFEYDMYLVAGRRDPRRLDGPELADRLGAAPGGRVAQAWMEVLGERGRLEAALRESEADRAARLEAIHRLEADLRASEAASQAALREAAAALRASDADREARLAVIQRLDAALRVPLWRRAAGRLRRLAGRAVQALLRAPTPRDRVA